MKNITITDSTDYNAIAQTIIKTSEGNVTDKNVAGVAALLKLFSLKAQKAGSDNAFELLRLKMAEPTDEEKQMLEAVDAVNKMMNG